MREDEPTSEIELERIDCPLCGSAEASHFRTGRDLLYGVPGEFQLVRCARCGHVYLNPRPTLATIHHCYPAHYGPHHLVGAGKTLEQSANCEAEPAGTQTQDAAPMESPPARRPWYLSTPVRRVPGLRRLYYWLRDDHSTFIPGDVGPNPRAFEVGCASGTFLKRLEALGWTAEGAELAESPAAVARDAGHHVHTGTLESAALSDDTYDAVFAWMVVEHLHDPLAALREVYRVLRPCGCFAFSVPNAASWESRVFGRYWHALHVPVHLQQFRPRTLREMLERTGFEDVRVIHQCNALNLVGSVGLLLEATGAFARLGRRLVRFTDHPTMWGQLALAPLAKLLAALRQSGRLTVVARVKK